MTLSTLASWLSARHLDLHVSHRHGEWTLIAIRGPYVRQGIAADIDQAIELLQVAVDGSWRAEFSGAEKVRKAG